MTRNHYVSDFMSTSSRINVKFCLLSCTPEGTNGMETLHACCLFTGPRQGFASYLILTKPGDFLPPTGTFVRDRGPVHDLRDFFHTTGTVPAQFGNSSDIGLVNSAVKIFSKRWI